MDKILFIIVLQITKTIRFLISTFHLGSGSNFPGKVALFLQKDFIKHFKLSKHCKIIMVTGTNGKSTTCGLLANFLRHANKTVIYNEMGANLKTGIASTLSKFSNLFGKIKSDFMIFEIDEATLPLIIKELKPDIIAVTNLFRDQLDRFGELDTTAKLIEKGLNNIQNTMVLLNADDSRVAFLKTENRKLYYGFSNIHEGYPTNNGDSPAINQGHPYNGEWISDPEEIAYCPHCKSKLEIVTRIVAHLGNYICPKCRLKKPPLDFSITNYKADNLSTNFDIVSNNQRHNYFLPFIGTFNIYNSLCAIAIAETITNITPVQIQKGLQSYSTIFGRSEKLNLHNKTCWIYLIKNPSGTTEVLKTLSEIENARFLIALNDNLADGRDVSWIWDARFDFLSKQKKDIFVSGKRAYDMALRLKYADIKENQIKINENISKSIHEAVVNIDSNETLYILPTYTVLLEMQKKGFSKKT